MLNQFSLRSHMQFLRMIWNLNLLDKWQFLYIMRRFILDNLKEGLKQIWRWINSHIPWPLQPLVHFYFLIKNWIDIKGLFRYFGWYKTNRTKRYLTPAYSMDPVMKGTRVAHDGWNAREQINRAGRVLEKEGHMLFLFLFPPTISFICPFIFLPYD